MEKAEKTGLSANEARFPLRFPHRRDTLTFIFTELFFLFTFYICFFIYFQVTVAFTFTFTLALTFTFTLTLTVKFCRILV